MIIVEDMRVCFCVFSCDLCINEYKMHILTIFCTLLYKVAGELLYKMYIEIKLAK